jgi:hypothetical protein
LRKNPRNTPGNSVTSVTSVTIEIKQRLTGDAENGASVTTRDPASPVTLALPFL